MCYWRNEDREIKRQYQLRESASFGATGKKDLPYHQDSNENSMIEGQKIESGMLQEVEFGINYYRISTKLIKSTSRIFEGLTSGKVEICFFSKIGASSSTLLRKSPSHFHKCEGDFFVLSGL